PGPEELRRKRLDAVGRCHDEHRGRRTVPADPALLEPGEQASDDPARDARIEVAGARTGQGLLDLVDVQHARSHGLGEPEGLRAWDWPTRLPSTRAISSRRSGRPQLPAIARASRLLPVPGTPSRSTPFGRSRGAKPHARASAPRASSALSFAKTSSA